MGGRTAAMGQPLSAKGHEAAEVDPDMLALWFGGIELSVTDGPPVVVLPDYPSVPEDRSRAVAELGRLAVMRKSRWRDVGSYPPDLRVCPPHLIVKEDKVRVGRDWSNVLYPHELLSG